MAGELRRGKTFQPTVAGSYSGPKHFERKYLKEERIIFKTVTLLEFYSATISEFSILLSQRTPHSAWLASRRNGHFKNNLLFFGPYKKGPMMWLHEAINSVFRRWSVSQPAEPTEGSGNFTSTQKQG